MGKREEMCFAFNKKINISHDQTSITCINYLKDVIGTCSHLVPAGHLPSGICNCSRTKGGTFSTFLPYSRTMEEISYRPTHFISHKNQLFFPSISIGPGPQPVDTLNCEHSH